VSAVAEIELARSSIPAIKILSAVPVVRCAILVRHKPTLTRKQTEDAHDAVKRDWSRFAEAYRAKVAEVTGVPEHQLTFDGREKHVRYRIDGKTPMIDLPRLRTLRAAPVQFDQRSCVALCIDDFSSKVWTRVGPPQGDLGFDIEKIGQRTEAYRRQADAFGRWFYGEFFSITEAVFAQNEPTETGRFEVTTVGLQVEGEPDDDYFDDWLLSDDRPNLENADLCRFLADAGNVRFDLRDLDRCEPDSYWMSIPNTVELPNGDLASRRFLCLVRPIGDDRFVVGIGFDDSGRGKLAGDVALKISRFIANRI
jgi:hypothetical protein